MFVNDIFESFQDNTQVDTVSLDFLKAFEKVPTLVLLVNFLSGFRIILQLESNSVQTVLNPRFIQEYSILGLLLFLVCIIFLMFAIFAIC